MNVSDKHGKMLKIGNKVTLNGHYDIWGNLEKGRIVKCVKGKFLVELSEGEVFNYDPSQVSFYS